MRIKTGGKIPPPIPGMKYWEDSSTADGPPDALIAAGLLSHYRPPGNNMLLPGNVEWRRYQVDGVRQMVDILRAFKGGILADDMGLGKTPQGAAIAHILGQPTLIVCPAGVRHQWAAWAEKLGHHCAVLGPPSEMEFQPHWAAWGNRKCDWACVSYTLMDKAILTRQPGFLMFDEMHSQLQGRANTYVKFLWKWGKMIPYKMGLTGTPYLSKPAGLWQVLNILLGMTFGKAREFDIRYANGAFDRSGSSHEEELKERLSMYMVRRMKAEVAQDLPKVTRTVRWVDADPKATGALAVCGYSISGLRGAVRATLAGKDKELVQLVNEARLNGQSTTVFTWMRDDADRLGFLLNKSGMHAAVIHGEHSAAERAKMVEAAWHARTSVVTTYGSSGQGLDGLQRWISNVIYHAIDPVPAILLQASGRHDRIGQTQPVTETFLAMKESVDQLTVDKVINRFDTWTKVLGSDRSSSAIRAAMVAGGMDPNDDAVLDSIFKEMTR